MSVTSLGNVLGKQMELKRRASSRILVALREGIVPWSRPSRFGYACGLPRNAATGRAYRGVNPWLLELTAIERNFRSPLWATYQQWTTLGGTVFDRDGTLILHCRTCPLSGIALWTPRTVYNREQVLGALEIADAERTPDYAEAARIADASGARFRPDTKPRYYQMGKVDWIGMPGLDWCLGGEPEWWSVKFHELTHWAVLGKTRIGWDGDDSLGELIAEMGAAYLTDHCGIPMRGSLEPHGDHVRCWKRDMGKATYYIFEASEKASEAANFILDLAKQPT